MAAGEPAGVTCSALKKIYRDKLRRQGVVFVYMQGTFDDGKEVDGRGLEELVAATAAFLLAFLQGFKQGLGGLARCGKVEKSQWIRSLVCGNTFFARLSTIVWRSVNR